jgi:hypothetical protein
MSGCGRWPAASCWPTVNSSSRPPPAAAAAPDAPSRSDRTPRSGAAQAVILVYRAAAHNGGSARGYQELSAPLANPTTAEPTGGQAVCLCMASTGPGHLPGVRPSRQSRGGVLPRPGIARGLRAHGRSCRALGEDLDPGTRCPRRARPAGSGRSPYHPGARNRALGLDRNLDPGPRWRPDRPGRGSRRSPSPPRPAIGVTANMTNTMRLLVHWAYGLIPGRVGRGAGFPSNRGDFVIRILFLVPVLP